MRTTRSRLAAVFVVVALALCLLSLSLHDPIAKIEADTPANKSTDPQPAPRASPRTAGAKEVSESPAYESESLPFRTSVFSVANPRELFDTHVGPAERGDPDSMLTMAQVAETCSFTGRFKSWDEWVEATPIAQSGQVSSETLEMFKGVFDRLASDCSYVNSHAPVDPDYGIGNWSADWYKKAADAGNPIAQLMLLWIRPASEETRHAMARLLDQNMPSRDYRLHYLAAYFLGKYRPEDENASVAKSWEYLACLHDSQCDAAAMRSWLDEAHSPATVDQILEAATRFEQGEVPNGGFLSISSFNPDAPE